MEKLVKRELIDVYCPKCGYEYATVMTNSHLRIIGAETIDCTCGETFEVDVNISRNEQRREYIKTSLKK